MDGYATAEEAARGDIPPQHARVAAISEFNDYAFVVMEMNDPPWVEVEESLCHRVDDVWREEWEGGGLGAGWSVVGESGVVTLSGEAPDDVATVRVRFRDEIRECPVRGGYFLFIEWGVSLKESEAVDEPVVVAHVKTNGDILDPPEDPERLIAVHRWFREHLDRIAVDAVGTESVGLRVKPDLPDDMPDFVRDYLRDLLGRGGPPEVGGSDDTSS